MCIPIALHVPVVTIDGQPVGTAREIICSCPGDRAGELATSATGGAGASDGDLWLRVTRPAQADLYIPFGEIAETRPDWVCLRVAASGLALGAWERMPAGVPVPA